MDIPLIELSDVQLGDLKEMLKVEVAIDVVTGEQISIQKLFSYHEMNKASETAERIFAQVFNKPANYKLVIETFS
jgi:hypothetical protein